MTGLIPACIIWKNGSNGGLLLSLTEKNDSRFVYEGFTYKITELLTDGGMIQIKKDDLSLNSRIQTYTKNRDSIIVNWQLNYPTGYNPFTRPFLYRKVSALKKSLPVVFDSLCHFADHTVNIYGFPIQRTTFTEIYLLATRFKSTSYPTTDVLYKAINNLRNYLEKQGAAEKYYPMTNTKQTDSSQYETMIAISIDKKIPVVDDFFISQMVPMEDRFLVTEVTGGPAEIEKAHKAVEKYMSDHSLSSPARPFEILVSERNKITDSTRWITKIFYPSM